MQMGRLISVLVCRCVFVEDDVVVASGSNMTNTSCNVCTLAATTNNTLITFSTQCMHMQATRHAEMEAIDYLLTHRPATDWSRQGCACMRTSELSADFTVNPKCMQVYHVRDL